MSDAFSPTCDVIHGDALQTLEGMRSRTFQACITSPPYFNLRDYGIPGQIGLEDDPGEYIHRLEDVFREVYRVLRDDGVLWVVIGDTYAKNSSYGLKRKDLIGIPWMLAFSLRRAGWYLRQDIIWAKPNPFPESVKDRCTRSHEYIFMLTKSDKYRFEADRIAEKSIYGDSGRADKKQGEFSGKYHKRQDIKHISDTFRAIRDKRNKRDVWTISTSGYRGSHFAVYPEELVKTCLLATTDEGDTVLDPFAGSGTTGLVAAELGRNAVLIDISAEYCQMARERIEPIINQTRINF